LETLIINQKNNKLKQEQRWQEWIRKKIDFYISTNKWDRVSIIKFHSWLENFDDIGKKYALAILNHFIYYSEVEVKQLCKNVIKKVIFKDQLLNTEESNDFHCSDKMLNNELENRIQETLIAPLLSEGNPTESGNYIAREYTTTGLIKQEQVIRPDEIITRIQQRSCKRILFVDDFLGTNVQLTNFWNNENIPIGIGNKKKSLIMISNQYPTVNFEYVSLVATEYGLENIQERVPGLKVYYCEKLTNEYRIFNEKSIFFEDQNDRINCKNYLENLCNNKNIPIYGVHGLDFAIAFYHGAPNSCLPIFWKSSRNWEPLFSRRM